MTGTVVRLLLVEDDPMIGESIEDGLRGAKCADRKNAS